MKKILAISTSVISLFALSVVPAFAHVVVKPAEVGTAAFQTFTMGVPNEKEDATVEVRLVIPEGLKYVSPNVKPGWTIDVQKTGSGEDVKVTEITWTGGEIPAGQRDDFYFSAQAPATETNLNWKAYQTYADGTIVAWDQEPKENGHGDEEVKQYSITKVVNDIATSDKKDHNETAVSSSKVDQLTILSFVALALSAIALSLQLRRKEK